MKSVILILSGLLFGFQSFSQVEVKGKIQNSQDVLFQKFKILIEKDKVLIDSFYSNDLGYYNTKLESGRYVFHVSKYLLNRSFPIVIGDKNSTINLYIDQQPVGWDNNPFNHNPLERHSLMDESVSISSISMDSKKTAKSDIPVSKYSVGPSDDNEKGFHAGQLTAGHWRDLDNWSEWLKTTSNKEISAYTKTWGFHLNSNLIKIEVDGNNNKALPFAKVICMGQKNDTLWVSQTDINGHAYIWPSAFQNQNYEQLKLIVRHNQTSKTLYINPQKKIHHVSLDVTQSKITNLELGFVVDATGSMGDEINYLKNELTDVISKIQKQMPCVNVRTGAVFYKDHSDEYVSRCLPLDENTARTITFISEQFGGGGGDYPEAVDVAMERSITELDWSDNNSIKLMFLLLDAPPHEDHNSLIKMRKYSKLAAEKGIQIIPIAASGINQKTEFLMKSIAIVTNGEYIYITDDSKIGNSHIKPTGGESKVTFLNDLMVETILKYSGEPCKNSSNQNNDPNHQNDTTFQYDNRNIISSDSINITVFPNPCADYLMVECSKKAEKVMLYDMNGKEIISVVPETRIVKVETSQLRSGVYSVRIQYDKFNVIQSKIVVMH